MDSEDSWLVAGVEEGIYTEMEAGLEAGVESCLEMGVEDSCLETEVEEAGSETGVDDSCLETSAEELWDTEALALDPEDPQLP
jgi:hypothetical protein